MSRGLCAQHAAKGATPQRHALLSATADKCDCRRNGLLGPIGSEETFRKESAKKREKSELSKTRRIKNYEALPFSLARSTQDQH